MTEASEDLGALLARIALRDRAAFSALYSAQGPKLFGLCLRMMKERRAAEDVLQDVFVKVWMNADRYAPEVASPVAWLNAVARNLCIDRLRARKGGDVDVEVLAEMPSQTPTPEAEAIRASEGRRIEDCMGRLERDRAEAVRRAYVEGESYLELAERFGVPLNTMRSWLRRSLMSLRACLEP